ncbi:tyrosine-type recombinase/integrase [Niabella insulamsoli]|uniref:site-specific integrase n=1 Tax=Niabella insulamsoli TaxID=3144874 RepID=UPI0031FD5798
MAYVNFYLDKPFSDAKSRTEIKHVIADCNKAKKHYPKSILNSNLTALYLFFTPVKGSRLKIRTTIKITPEHWDFRKGKYKSTVPGSLELNNELENLSSNLKKKFILYKESGSSLSAEDIKQFLEKFMNGDAGKKDGTLLRARETFLEKKIGLLSEGTLKEYRTVFKSLSDYELQKKLTLNFSSFNQSFFESYEKFLIEKKNPKQKKEGLLNDTIAKYTATLKTFLQWAFENGLHKNRSAFSKIKTQIKKRSKNEIVALMERELMDLLHYDFSGNERLEKVRDLFCFGCFTGQRFSDIMNFSKLDFDGKKWDFIALKNKKRVVVPMTGFIANAVPIIEKYSKGFPVISNQKFNEYLKEIGEKVKINNPVKIVRYRGTQQLVFTRPKHEFMSSHMARRTFVTLSLEKGVPITIVQKITQHADLRTLIKYEAHSTEALFQSFKNT